MKKAVKCRSLIKYFVSSCLIMLITLSGGCLQEPDINIGSVEKGFIDLGEHNFKNDGMVELNGDWEFYYSNFVNSLEKTSQSKIYQYVPQNWQKYVLSEKKLPLYGWATYRVQIKVPDAEKVYGLHVNRIFTAYRLYIDGSVYVERGHIGTSPKGTKAKIMPATVFFKPQQSEVELLVQVSNFHYYQGGIVDPIIMGTPEQLSEHNLNNMIFNLLFAGIIVGIGLYHLLLYSLFRQDKSPLWFAILCFMVFMQYIFEGEMIISSLFSGMSLQVEETIQTMEHFIIMPSLMHLFYHMFNGKLSLRMMRLTDIISILCILGIIIMPFDYLYPIWTIYSPVIIAAIIYLLVFLYGRMIDKTPNSLLAFAGYLVFAVCAVNDLFISLNILSGHFLMPFGLLVFILCQGILIARKFSSAFNTIEQLSVSLKQSNVSLKIAYEKMEQRVMERTEKLQKANEEIEIINRELLQDKMLLEKAVITDGLTGLYNRTYANQRLQEELEKTGQKSLCICMLDIDHFKNVNDTYGHSTGDRVLKAISRIMVGHSRKTDIVARYGGEEFIIILPGTRLDQGYQVAERIREAVAKANIIPGLKVTISGGIREYKHKGLEDYLRETDDLLYQAKNNGRNRIEKSESDLKAE